MANGDEKTQFSFTLQNMVTQERNTTQLKSVQQAGIFTQICELFGHTLPSQHAGYTC